MTWTVGNGRVVRFWKDNQVSNHGQLDQYWNEQTSQGVNIPVCFYVNAKGDWNLEKIVLDLPMNVVETIKTLKPPCMGGKTNYLEQNNVVDDCCSIKDVYLELSNVHTLQESMLFKIIWCWDGSKWIRFHLWKIGLGVLPTNELSFNGI